jgi:hypothetical protein
VPGRVTFYRFIMAYDMEFWNDYTCELPSHPYKCSPACSPQETVEFGIATFLNLGISPGKLVLGLPWYRDVSPFPQ